MAEGRGKGKARHEKTKKQENLNAINAASFASFCN